MNYLVAVSGGIDSVVLLDILAAGELHELTVAHFDHGIRDDSSDDARFVEALAAKYKVPYVSRREKLGRTAGETLARARRYTFLSEEAQLLGATIATAHHQDDVVETIAINVIRGTGWRGLAVFDGTHIARPLLGYDKQQIRDYALKHSLEWVEDSTNQSDVYLRNRLRFRLHDALPPELFQRIITLWQQQVVLRREIEREIALLMEQGRQSRHFYIQIPEKTAEELLRARTEHCLGRPLTRPQIRQALLAIKTARSGTKFPLGDAWLELDAKTFNISVKTP